LCFLGDPQTCDRKPLLRPTQHRHFRLRLPWTRSLIQDIDSMVRRDTTTQIPMLRGQAALASVSQDLRMCSPEYIFQSLRQHTLYEPCLKTTTERIHSDVPQGSRCLNDRDPPHQDVATLHRVRLRRHYTCQRIAPKSLIPGHLR